MSVKHTYTIRDGYTGNPDLQDFADKAEADEVCQLLNDALCMTHTGHSLIGFVVSVWKRYWVDIGTEEV